MLQFIELSQRGAADQLVVENAAVDPPDEDEICDCGDVDAGGSERPVNWATSVTQNDTEGYVKQIEFNEGAIYLIELIR
jgi:hypothetical protein